MLNGIYISNGTDIDSHYERCGRTLTVLVGSRHQKKVQIVRWSLLGFEGNPLYLQRLRIFLTTPWRILCENSLFRQTSLVHISLLPFCKFIGVHRMKRGWTEIRLKIVYFRSIFPMPFKIVGGQRDSILVMVTLLLVLRQNRLLGIIN